MPKCCIICSAVASPALQLQYCDVCLSAIYCSRACQRLDWEKQHRGICKLLNVGHGGMQVRTVIHTSRQIELKAQFEGNESCLNEGDKIFFKLFRESTFEESRAAAKKMKRYTKQQTTQHQKFLLLHSLCFLIRFSNSEMLSWPNSPLLVLLQFVDPSVLFGNEELRITPLHHLANLADPFDYSTHANQLILAKQLIERGAKIKAVSSPHGHGTSPLHTACVSANVTNLDFVEFLLERGADPNAQDRLGLTPLMYTTPSAPSAAKFLLNWPTTNANITARSGVSFLDSVRMTITTLSDEVAVPDNPEQVQDQFQLQQWREIEEMLVERGAVDTGTTSRE
jgi:hypothetical protein